MDRVAWRSWRIVFFAVLLAAGGASAAGDKAARKEFRAQAALAQLQRALRGETNRAAIAELQSQIDEVSAARENNRRGPVPPHIDIVQLPYVHYRYASARVGVGTTAATNLAPAGNDMDASTVDPLPSSFWHKPATIPAHDLATGFNRAARPDFESAVWHYSAPKTSFGGHAGFEAKSGGRRIRIKFGEIHSEPFAARVFHALGYNADPTDYSPGLKIRYDRRLFTEFNSRKPVDTRITAFGILPVWTIHFQPVHDPFACIQSAVLTNGSRVPGEALRRRLMRGGKFDESFEATVDYLVTVPANVQIHNSDEQSIGPWDFGQLGHERRRELRAAGLLAAWLGWYDSRVDNTRLRVVRHGEALELKHYFSDLGGGLGKSIGLLSRHAEDVKEFPRFFTEAAVRQGPHQMAIPFRIVHFRPIEPTAAFEQMTLEDARWMARMIAQFTPGQIEGALRACGFNESEAGAYKEKLLTRREKMLADLGEPRR